MYYIVIYAYLIHIYIEINVLFKEMSVCSSVLIKLFYEAFSKCVRVMKIQLQKQTLCDYK